MTQDEAEKAQQWAGMDGVMAWQLIERHADNWTDIGYMMNAWLSANVTKVRPISIDMNLAMAIADQAGIHNAPTNCTWTQLFNLIDAACSYERESCAKIALEADNRHRITVERIAAEIRSRGSCAPSEVAK